MRKSVFLAIFLAFLCISRAVAQNLPSDLKIVPPGAGVPPRLAQLSGIWEGAWDFEAPPGGGTRHLFLMDVMGRGVKIAIVNITPPKVEAIYSFGGSSQNPGKWFQVRDASISGDSIVLRWGQPGKKRTVTLRPSGNPGVAQATLQPEESAQVLKATLRKK